MKQKKTVKAMLAAILTFALAFATVGPAFAANKNDDGVITNTENEKDVEASITKVIETGEYTTVPAATFTFKFTQIKEGERDGFSIATDNKELSDVRISTSAANATEVDTNERIKTVTFDSGNFLQGVTFPHAGVYAYKVTEEQSGWNGGQEEKETKNGNEKITEKMTWSKAEYTIYIYVKNKEDGSGTYIAAITDFRTAGQNGIQQGQPGAESELGQKIDPTPNPVPEDPDDQDYDPSDMYFTNKYIKIITKDPGPGPDPDPENASLKIKKIVDGAVSDKNATFKFNFTLKAPKAFDATQFVGTIYDANNVAQGQKVIVSLTNGVGTVEDVELKDGWTLAFNDTPVGTHFAVEEQIINGWEIPKIETKDAKGSNTTTNKWHTGTEDKIVGEDVANGVTVTNKQKNITPTGIIMNNLPFVVMIGVAAAAIVALAVVKAKKRVTE